MSERRLFHSYLDDFQKDMAVILLIDRLDQEGKTAMEIWNLLAREEDQYHREEQDGK